MGVTRNRTDNVDLFDMVRGLPRKLGFEYEDFRLRPCGKAPKTVNIDEIQVDIVRSVPRSPNRHYQGLVCHARFGCILIFVSIATRQLSCLVPKDFVIGFSQYLILSSILLSGIG